MIEVILIIALIYTMRRCYHWRALTVVQAEVIRQQQRNITALINLANLLDKHLCDVTGREHKPMGDDDIAWSYRSNNVIQFKRKGTT